MENPRVLFVCLGNICRSPLAEGLFRKRASEAGLTVAADSAGTGDWHVGEPPQQQSQDVARVAGFDISDIRARRVSPEDFTRFTHIVAMDEMNERDLASVRPQDGGTVEVARLLSYSALPEKNVLDPYGMSDDAFQKAYAQIESGVEGLLARLRQAH